MKKYIKINEWFIEITSPISFSKEMHLGDDAEDSEDEFDLCVSVGIRKYYIELKYNLTKIDILLYDLEKIFVAFLEAKHKFVFDLSYEIYAEDGVRDGDRVFELKIVKKN